MGVYLGGSHITVAEKFLDRADVVTLLQQARREAVAEGMALHVLGDASLPPGQ